MYPSSHPLLKAQRKMKAKPKVRGMIKSLAESLNISKGWVSVRFIFPHKESAKSL